MAAYLEAALDEGDPALVAAALGAIARAKGFLLVASSPLTRSSYHAGDDFAKMRDARAAQLVKANGAA